MKILHLFIFLFLAVFTNAQVWLVDPLEAIYPDSNNLDGYNNKWTADVPMGTVAGVHVLIKKPAGTQLHISASIERKELPPAYWHQLIDVPVEQNTGLDSRTEQFINEINPYVIRRAPFRIYEVIKPAASANFVTENNYTALRLSIPPEKLTWPGKYRIDITVKAGSREHQARFTVAVHEVTLPTLADGRFFYTNWFNLQRMEEQHNVERWTDAWFAMLDKYAALMAYGRQNCIIVPGELIGLKEGRIVLEEDKMLRFIDVFRQNGFQYFESPHLMYRGDNDDWGAPELKVILTKRGYFSDAARQDIDTLVTLIKNFTEKNNLTYQWLQHIADEPTQANARCYRDVVKQVKSIYPEIKIMEATNDRDSIVGAVDLWCPLINDFQENEAFFRDREKEGEKVLVYTCLVPGGKWLNRTLDMEKLRQVYFGWGAVHYNTFGYLHWGLNQYKADPFAQSVVHHPSPAATPNNFLPAGDTHVIYPGEAGPLSSLRFEAHRLGIEDYELLQRLKEKKPKRCGKLVGKLFTSYTDYNTSVTDYRKVRKKLLQSL